MADMLDYLAWRGDIEFTQMPVNPVDALIFSTLSYIQFEDIVPDNPMQSISLQEAAAGLFSLAEPQTRVRVKKDLELLDVITEIADDLYYGCGLDEYTQSTDPRDIAWEKKYVYMEYPSAGND